MSLARLRHDYRRPALRESSVPPEPLTLFRRWMRAAIRAGLPEPTAAALGTTGPAGRPAVRFVLLKQVDARGFTFFTNYASAKGRQLDALPRAALAWWWPGLERQVRVEGRVVQVSAAESDAYFALRPRGARLGAWASQQSRLLGSAAELARAMARVARRFEGREIPRPPHWGGLRVVPSSVEFWQGRSDRLHDRLRYRRVRGAWRLERLAP
jgi:pyridoxamine 5'-phosphate oxidase